MKKDKPMPKGATPMPWMKAPKDAPKMPPAKGGMKKTGRSKK